MMRTLITQSAVALVAVGASTLTAVSVQAASFLPNPGSCNVSQVSLSTQCAGIYGGPGNNFNPTPSEVLDALNNDDLFGDINDWRFDRRQQGSGSFGDNTLGLTLTGLGSTSGTFSFANIRPEITNLVIGLKAGTRYVLYFIPKNTYTANQVFNWSTSDLFQGQGQGGSPLALSNFNVFYQVPTPALLPGLIGMGVAALRKRRGESDDSAEA